MWRGEGVERIAQVIVLLWCWVGPTLAFVVPPKEIIYFILLPHLGCYTLSHSLSVIAINTQQQRLKKNLQHLKVSQITSHNQSNATLVPKTVITKPLFIPCALLSMLSIFFIFFVSYAISRAENILQRSQHMYHQHKKPLSVTSSFQLPRRPTLRSRY